MKSQVKVTTSKLFLQIQTEPYVIYGRMGFTPVVDVINVQSGEIGYLIITALSLGEVLQAIREENEQKLTGVVISIEKASAQRMSPYVVSRIS
jgi:hypothetical protein